MANGMKLSGGTIVNATLIAAPSSTKNQEKSLDTKMKQAKKGNEWHFGMKLHIGTDSPTGPRVTSANASGTEPEKPVSMATAPASASRSLHS